MGKIRRTPAAKCGKDSQPPNAPKLLLHVEPKHADDDEITASAFPFHELIPHWSTFNPNTKNPATGSKFANGHHGASGGKKLSDFKNFRVACCLEFVNKVTAAGTYRVRCMNVFTVDSNQCTTHGKTTHKDGPNKIYTYMKRNDTATWGMIKDTEDNEPAEVVPNWQKADRRREAAAAELDQAFAKGIEVDDTWETVSTALGTDSCFVERHDTALAHAKGRNVRF